MADFPSHAELPGSPIEGTGLDGSFTATRKLLCDWGDRRALQIEILGEEYPHIPDTGAYVLTTSCAPVDAKIDGEEGLAAVESTIVHEKAIVTVNYGLLEEPGPREGDYFEDFIPTGEFLTVDYRGLYWNADADENNLVQITDGASLGKLFFAGDYLLRVFNLVTYPTDTLSLIGSINEKVFATKTSYLSGIEEFPIETLLFQPAMMELVLKPDGDYSVTATYRMNYKPEGHNKFWYPGGQGLAAGWRQPKDTDGNDADMYEILDFGEF